MIDLTKRLEASLSAIAGRDHVCVIHEGEDEVLAFAAAFAAAGLAAHQQCLVVHEETPERVVAALALAGVQLDALPPGQLQLREAESVYLADGTFDPVRQVERLRELARAARADGYAGLRIVADASSISGDERFLEYEARVDEALRGEAASALCLYDRRRLPQTAVARGVLAHRLVIHEGQLLENVLCSAASAAHASDPGGDLDSILERLHRTYAERTADSLNRRLAQVLDGSNDGFWSCDLRTGALEVSRRSAELAGFEPWRAPSRLRDWEALIHPDDRDEVVRAWKEHLAGGTTDLAVEHRLRGRDGVDRWVLVRGRVVERGPAGDPLRAAGTHTDITARRSTEEALRAALAEREKLVLEARHADRIRAVGTLAAGVVHEINNPIAYVIANLHYAIERLGENEAGADPDLLASLREALDGAGRVREIVKDVKMFAHDDANDPGTTAIADVVRAALNIAGHEVRRRAEVVTELDPVPPVVGSAHRLTQVLVNLVVNAAQAIPEGRRGRIRIEVRPRDARSVEIAVRDDGIGIGPEDLQRVFEPFFTTKAMDQGTGLGLSISRRIVEGLGGTLTVESARGVGTTFRISLPAASETSRRTAQGVRRARVLVVDDEPAAREAIARILRGHDIVQASSGERALALLAAEPFDVVLCDLLMPGMTGMQLHAAVAARAPALAERFVFVTGGAFTPSAHAFLAERPFVEKPIDAARLRELVAARLEVQGAA